MAAASSLSVDDQSDHLRQSGFQQRARDVMAHALETIVTDMTDSEKPRPALLVQFKNAQVARHCQATGDSATKQRDAPSQPLAALLPQVVVRY